jgi:4-amino-4-deoxy-L-arabinose transferase-like glycosyltransferase
VAALISLGTVLFIWRAGLAARDAPTGLVAALIAGLLPMFAFRAGHVSNDALLACASAATTWGIVRLVREPFAWPVAWGTAAAVGVAYLSKISAIALVPPLAFALVAAQPAAAWTTRAVRLSALGLAGAIVLPWTIRNVVLYGDPFASDAMRTAVAHIITDRSLFSSFFVTDFPRVLAKSFVGMFGWAALLLPGWLYRLYWLFFAAGGLGVAIGLVRRTLDWRLVAVLALAGLAALAVVVRINLQFTQLQGRYLLPGLPAFAVLMALGLRSLVPDAAFGAPRRLLRTATSPLVLGLLLAAGNLGALLGVVWPAYYPAPMRTLDSGVRVIMPTLVTDMQMLDLDFGYVVTGSRPGWMSPVDVEAAAFSSLEVELTGTATPSAQRGCVLYASTGRDLDANPAICFDWLADGRPHVVRLALRGHDGWIGRVTHVRLDPFVDGTGIAGWRVRTGNPRLLPGNR